MNIILEIPEEDVSEVADLIQYALLWNKPSDEVLNLLAPFVDKHKPPFDKVLLEIAEGLHDKDILRRRDDYFKI